MANPEGEVLADRYRVEGVLGRGGMGEVRAGSDLLLGREVAIKLLHHGLSGDERFNRRFENEARAAARLAHPNVVHVYDAGEHDGRPFIVMERLDGRTLADEIAAGQFTEQRAREVGAQMLAALEAAHAANVLHRDMKPSNVLLASDGSVRVGDFGIAKSDYSTDGTTTGTVVGTLAYLSPERLHGAPATRSSDCYSVGVVLYEALAGRRPYVADNPVGLLDAMQRGRPAPLDELRPDVDKAFCLAIMRAISPDESQRFSGAAEFAAALRTDPVRRETVRAVAPHGDTAEFPAPAPAPIEAGGSRRKLASILLIVAIVGAAIGAGIGVRLRDNGSNAGSTPPLVTTPAQGMERALQELEQAVSR
jgi:serine/threonine protein kinase